MNIFTKWGYIIIIIFILVTIIIGVLSGGVGLSTWLSENYVPKKIFIVEKYPVRIIMFGEYSDVSPSEKGEQILKLIQELNKVKFEKGTFTDELNINVGSNLNTKQIRSSQRGITYIIPENEYIKNKK